MGLEGTVDLKQCWFCWNLSLHWGWGILSPLNCCLLLYGILCNSCFSPCFINQSEELCWKSQGDPSVPLAWVSHCVFQGADRVSVPSLLPPPASFLLWEKHCWNTPAGRWTRKGFGVSNAFDSEMWASSTALPVCLSCLINSSFLAEETLIRGHYILSSITCHEGLLKELSSVHSTSKGGF